MANVNITFDELPVVTALDGTEIMPLDQGGTTKQATLNQIINGGIQTNFPGAIEYVIDGGSLSIATGLRGILEVPFDCTINYIDIYLSSTGSVEIDILNCTYDQYDAGATHPVPGDSVLGGSYPTITNDTKARVSYGNAISIASGSVVGFYVRSSTNAIICTISIKIVRAIP